MDFITCLLRNEMPLKWHFKMTAQRMPHVLYFVYTWASTFEFYSVADKNIFGSVVALTMQLLPCLDVPVVVDI